MDHTIDMPNFFWVGLLIEAISKGKEKLVELLGKLYGEVSADKTWVEESIVGIFISEPVSWSFDRG